MYGELTEDALGNFVAGVNSLFGGHRLAAREPALKGTLRFDDGSAYGRQHLESWELVTHPNVEHRLMTTMMASRLHEAFKASFLPASPSAALKAAIMLYMLQEQHRCGGKAASPVVLLSLPLPGVEGVRRSWLTLLPSQGLPWQADNDITRKGIQSSWPCPDCTMATASQGAGGDAGEESGKIG